MCEELETPKKKVMVNNVCMICCYIMMAWLLSTLGVLLHVFWHLTFLPASLLLQAQSLKQNHKEIGVILQFQRKVKSSRYEKRTNSSAICIGCSCTCSVLFGSSKICHPELKQHQTSLKKHCFFWCISFYACTE